MCSRYEGRILSSRRRCSTQPASSGPSRAGYGIGVPTPEQQMLVQISWIESPCPGQPSFGESQPVKRPVPSLTTLAWPATGLRKVDSSFLDLLAHTPAPYRSTTSIREHAEHLMMDMGSCGFKLRWALLPYCNELLHQDQVS
jgi:hypothetical protein